jgi:hypothetical protein
MSTRSGRKPAGPGPKNAWNATLDGLESDRPTQAGEEPENVGDGLAVDDKGLDSMTGPGGYSGDAVESGVAEAEAQPERPASAEIHGDPRTAAGEEYPGDAKQLDQGKRAGGGDDLAE